MLENRPADQEDNNTADVARMALKPRRKRRAIDGMSLGVAALVALGAGGLYYMHMRTARAVEMVGEADANAAGVDAMLAGGREGLATLSQSVNVTRATIDRFSTHNTATLASAQRGPERDPFAFKTNEPDEAAPPAGSFNTAAREDARTRALVAARQLQVQSILFGSKRRSCLIGGKFYFEKQSVGEFTITRITADAVFVQSGESVFELRLRK